jgi:hypothetical protein
MTKIKETERKVTSRLKKIKLCQRLNFSLGRMQNDPQGVCKNDTKKKLIHSTHHIVVMSASCVRKP